MQHYEIRALQGKNKQVLGRLGIEGVTIVGGDQHLVVAASPSTVAFLTRRLIGFAEVRPR